MMGVALIVGGLVLMAPVRRAVVLQPAPGDQLREAFGGALETPVPEEMLALTQRIAGPLRLLQGGRER